MPGLHDASIRDPLLILIQGGIASGKSTVSRLLAERGARFVDCDKLAHEELLAPAIEAALQARFGARVVGPDGHIDRKALGAIVFDDPAALLDLERLVHPRVAARVAALVAAARRPAGEPREVLVIDAAVASKMELAGRTVAAVDRRSAPPSELQAGGRPWDLIVFVAASDEARRRRAATRGWPAGELERREARQTPLPDAKRRADVVVENDGDVAETESHVERIWTQFVEPRRQDPAP